MADTKIDIRINNPTKNVIGVMYSIKEILVTSFNNFFLISKNQNPQKVPKQYKIVAIIGSCKMNKSKINVTIK